MEPIDQARRYFFSGKGVPPAISGAQGHSQAFTAATALINGFALPRGEAEIIFREWNLTCQPPWSESELAHKLRQAETTPHNNPRGHLLSGKHNNGQSLSNAARSDYGASKHAGQMDKSKPAVKARQYELVKSPLPAPMEDGCRKLLKRLFKPGEGICIIPAHLDDDGKEAPNGAGMIAPLEDWLQKLEKKKGNPNGIFSSSDKTGIYLRLNPVRIGGTGHDSSVTDYRHGLLEFDKIPIEEQYALIIASKIPCAAITYSGGKSVHAIVKLDAKSLQEFKDRIEIIYDHFEFYKPDEQNKNVGRLSRLPNCERFSKRQELLSLDCGCASFDEWHNNEVEDSTLPPMEDASDFIVEEIDEPMQIIQGVLHQGSKMALGGGSKSYKTWTLLHLSLATSHGLDWLGFKTTKCKVMFVNFELHKFAFQRRIKSVASAMGIEIEKGQFKVLNLRGYSASYETLLPQMVKAFRGEKFGLVTLDPMYKLYAPGTDENSTGDIADLLNGFERFCINSGAAIVFGAHFSKGNQANKKSMDRISGAGVIGRDPDAILTFTELDEKQGENTYSVQSDLRYFPQVKPFAVRWNHPVFSRDDSIDPMNLKKAKGGKAKSHDVNRLLAAILDNDSNNPISVTGWAEAAGVQRTTLNDYLIEMREKGWIKTIGEGMKSRQCITDEGIAYLKSLSNEPF